jgi:hypothetical protein
VYWLKGMRPGDEKAAHGGAEEPGEAQDQEGAEGRGPSDPVDGLA